MLPSGHAGQYQFTVENVLRPEASPSPDQKRLYHQKVAAATEAVIRRHPRQWFAFEDIF